MVPSVNTGSGNGMVSSVNIGKGNCMVPSGDKPFCISTNIYQITSKLWSDAINVSSQGTNESMTFVVHQDLMA